VLAKRSPEKRARALVMRPKRGRTKGPETYLNGPKYRARRREASLAKIWDVTSSTRTTRASNPRRAGRAGGRNLRPGAVHEPKWPGPCVRARGRQISVGRSSGRFAEAGTPGTAARGVVPECGRPERHARGVDPATVETTGERAVARRADPARRNARRRRSSSRTKRSWSSRQR